MSAVGFRGFSDWAHLVSCVASGYGLSFELWYHAPLDMSPRRVWAKVLKSGKVRVAPAGYSWRSVFAFTADAGHLDRFCVRSVPSQKEAV